MSVDFIKEWQDVLEIKNGRDYKKVKDDNGEYPIYGSGELWDTLMIIFALHTL